MQENRKKKLISLGTETLADALLELTKTSETALDLVDRMVSGPEENIQKFKKELSRKRSRYFYKWNESEYFAWKLGGLLEDLKVGVIDYGNIRTASRIYPDRVSATSGHLEASIIP